MSYALDLKGLKKVYATGVEALRGIDLTVEEGDFYALLGPNGAGKSTTIGIIASLVNKTAGQVKVFDYDIDNDLERAKQQIGLVPQEFNFNPFETVQQIVVNQAGYYGVSRKEALKRSEKYLKQSNLWDKRNVRARMLSGGMKRRLMIARALMHEPRLLILDEPTAGVDIELRREMWVFLKELNESGTTIILTTHYLEEAETLCSRVGMMKQGEIVALDSTANLLNKFAGKQLRLTLGEVTLPANIQALLRNQESGIYTFALNDMAQIELVLSSLRSADIKVIDMQLNEADLEDVFMSLVGMSSMSQSS